MIQIIQRLVSKLTKPARRTTLTSQAKNPIIVWFRNDLRLEDHAALAAATEAGSSVICLYILEDDGALRPRGAASCWWLDKSLKSLRSDIAKLGGKIVCRKGAASQIVPALIEETGAAGVYWGRRYGQAGRDIDAALKSSLRDTGLDVKTFNTTLLTEPWAYETKSGGHYKVFTPYWRSVKASYSAPSPHAKPESLGGEGIMSDRIEDWNLHPESPDWSTGFSDVWTPGETGARKRLESFMEGPVRNYADVRNRPDIDDGTSGLSPHLHFGEISPAQVWRTVKSSIDHGLKQEQSAWTFLSEVVWREFSYVLRHYNPDFDSKNYNSKFDAMPWNSDTAALQAWQKGRSGYPIVDAGMRQLWETGWMHNRVRMIVASFLTKHLLHDWRDGEAWFWDTLVDADPANNSMGWQWVAGSGADAAPYFRIFNPIAQGEKFDPKGRYVRRWCPELTDLPNKYIHSPWTADADTLRASGVELGVTYPKPMIEHATGRERALEAYKSLQKEQDAA